MVFVTIYTYICGIAVPNVQDAVIAKGFVDIMSFSKLRDKDIYKMVKTINAIPLVVPAMAMTNNPLIIPPKISPVVAGCGRGCGCGRGRVTNPIHLLYHPYHQRKLPPQHKK
jgi:hypothetical protein